MSAHASPDVLSAVVDRDLPCARCDYNLRGLLWEGRCPECGAPVRKSIGLWRLSDSARRQLMVIAVLLLVAGAIPLVYHAMYRGWGRVHLMYPVRALAGLAVIWLSLLPLPDLKTRAGRWLGRLMRWEAAVVILWPWLLWAAALDDGWKPVPPWIALPLSMVVLVLPVFPSALAHFLLGRLAATLRLAWLARTFYAAAVFVPLGFISFIGVVCMHGYGAAGPDSWIVTSPVVGWGFIYPIFGWMENPITVWQRDSPFFLFFLRDILMVPATWCVAAGVAAAALSLLWLFIVLLRRRAPVPT